MVNGKFNDELLNKRNNVVLAKGFDIFTLCLCISSILKILKVTNLISDFYVEIVTIIIGGYVMLKISSSKLLCQADLDRYAQEVKDKHKSIGFIICLITMLVGELLYLLISKNMMISCLYLPVWIIPTLICNYKIMKKGILITGTENNRSRTLKVLKKRTFIGSVFFGLCLCGKDIYCNNTFRVSGVLWTFYAATAFGLLFYFLFKLILDTNDKKQSK
ncbi:MAG: hypothetical protein IKL07_01445 [Clostridium sp.]|nr:hypothetical protein [Clostridium sp.]